MSFDNLTDNQKLVIKHWLRNIVYENFNNKYNVEDILTINKEEAEKMTSNISKTLKEEYKNLYLKATVLITVAF